MASCTNPRSLIVSPVLSMRRRTHSPPKARPRMKAESISSKACVELPSTSASMRIQPISYMNDEAPVSAATTSSSRMRRALSPVRTRGPSGWNATPEKAGLRGSRITAAATPRLMIPEAIKVPGKPASGMK
jgi:hypothetical protein